MACKLHIHSSGGGVQRDALRPEDKGLGIQLGVRWRNFSVWVQSSLLQRSCHLPFPEVVPLFIVLLFWGPLCFPLTRQNI